MVIVTSNLGVGVSKVFFQKMANRLVYKQFTCREYFWLSSGSSEMEGSEKIYFTTEKTIIYTKSLGI